ncbi:P-loop containing nucleoside triphosphate hydrolase protein [Agrocybe pediades]|nr:P-loop containing nucleoside triphosphate hydrolase protein [Agrocybe pediades]
MSSKTLHDPNDMNDNTPRQSIDFNNDLSSPSTMYTEPSIRLLFSFLPRRNIIFLLLPAVLVSIIAGGVAPFMTFVLGQAFNTFADFSISPEPHSVAKANLLHGVGTAALELIGLAVGSMALSSLTSCLWIWIGEKNTMGLRKAVYLAVSQKDMSWFDMQMGASNADSSKEPVGAGGIMAKFSRETDEVRMASSLASGMLIQYLTTCITCLILAFVRSWALTLVILSALPILAIIQNLANVLAVPILATEREHNGVAATVIDRAAAAIATVKAFNAAVYEHARANAVFQLLLKDGGKINRLWASTSGAAQFVTMAIFVQAFWFGSKLVREGKISAGDVMAVFWACSIASSNLQMCIPQAILLAKGKSAMAELVTLIHDNPARTTSPAFNSPPRCAGEMGLYNVTFAYPSRPTVPVLSDVSLFLPANETTFIVGSSGSGKSTIAHLLLNMYEPQTGCIKLDGNNLRSLDQTWLRSHVACVGQQGGAGVLIFDDKSVFENIATALYGHSDEPPSREEVEDACRAALMHEFVRDLPQGYDTLLGGGSGVGLSGGQKQRLAIARAKLRNPTVLVLDEATSALDSTSRILVFEAIKRWRRNKTTIVITHDLSQIQPRDFVYVLKNGRVAEQGYRADLEEVDIVSLYNDDQGEFRKMMESQQLTGGFLPEKEVEVKVHPDFDVAEELEQEKELSTRPMSFVAPSMLMSRNSTFRPMTFSNWMFDVVADFTANKASDESTPASRQQRPLTAILSQDLKLPSAPDAAYTHEERRHSMPPTPTSTTFTTTQHRASEDFFGSEKTGFEDSAIKTRQARGGRREPKTQNNAALVVDVVKSNEDSTSEEDPPRFWELMRSIYPTVPQKPILFLGLGLCIMGGALTPLFSFLLSRLLFEISIGAQDVSNINFFGGLVLAVAAIDGLVLGLKYYLMETSGMLWITRMRDIAFRKVLSQDKKWFDRAQNSPVRLVQILVKDADDARELIAVVWAQLSLVVSMLGVGLVWALISGWQLTLAGVAIAPVFAVTMAVQTGLVARCEVRNKRSREEVAKGYYNTIINIRAVRSMAFDEAFLSQFLDSVDQCMKTGMRGAFVEGCTYGVATGLIYLAEALLFYVGAVLIANGTYTYLQMVQVLNLVIFTVSIGSQIMGFTQKIAKSVQAASDFDRLAKLDTKTDESRGVFCPELTRPIQFNQVNFAYPERREAPVLKNMQLSIDSGECVAIVGSSGSGKSTIASLLQRLYEPSTGSVTIGGIDTRFMNTRYLRQHVSVVSQQPHLFDASIADNIRYGQPSLTDYDVRCAAKAANIHEFIMSLPHGYATHVGENASLISGGQAQRLQIARALARPCNILILDECTSSLDKENRTAVLETIRDAARGRTTIMITHNLEAMKMCDRVMVVSDGEVVEEGRFEVLIERRGVFASLASGGEWMD